MQKRSHYQYHPSLLPIKRYESCLKNEVYRTHLGVVSTDTSLTLLMFSHSNRSLNSELIGPAKFNVVDVLISMESTSGRSVFSNSTACVCMTFVLA